MQYHPGRNFCISMHRDKKWHLLPLFSGPGTPISHPNPPHLFACREPPKMLTPWRRLSGPQLRTHTGTRPCLRGRGSWWQKAPSMEGRADILNATGMAPFLPRVRFLPFPRPHVNFNTAYFCVPCLTRCLLPQSPCH